MSAYKDALHVDATESGDRIKLAAELLASGSGVVVLNRVLALRPNKGEVLCEVICQPSQDPVQYQAAVQSAKALLAASSLSNVAAAKKQSWLAVDDYGTGTA